MSFLLSPIFSLQQNQRTRGWNRFCLRGWLAREEEGSGPNNVYMQVNVKMIFKNESILIKNLFKKTKLKYTEPE
jgi:hypothetical protein